MPPLHTYLSALMTLACIACAGEGAPAVQDAGAADVPVAPATPSMQLGTNPTGKTGPEQFGLLAEGGEVRVEWGFQGFHMLVFALRCDQGGPAPVWIELQLLEGDEVLASARLRRPSLDPGGDGAFYAWDIFVLTPDWDAWVDRPVLVDARLLDDEDRLVTAASVGVVVRPPPGLFD